MDENARFKSILITIAILVAGIGLLSWIVPALSEQKTSGYQSTTTSRINPKNRCLTASEAWNNVGKNTCVTFTIGWTAKSGGYFFIDEKKNYSSGFVVFIAKKGLISEKDFKAKYKVGKKISVTGTITWYKGYPQIKVYNLNQITVLN